MAYRSPYPDISVPNLNLFEMVLGKAPGRSSDVAMACGLTGRTITYGQLLDQIRRTAAGLAARGIKKGDVVSLWSPNVPEWPIVFFGVIRLGAIVHTSNPVSTPDELAFQLNDGNAKILVTVNALAEKAKAAIVESKIARGTVAAMECCYGAELYEPDDGVHPGIANTYLQSGAYGYLGSTTIAYGPAKGNGSADLICQYFLKSVCDGASLGRAALEARQKFASQSAELDPIDLKTLAQFVLLGDPSIHPVKSASAKA